jgi:heat shock protein HslJ
MRNHARCSVFALVAVMLTACAASDLPREVLDTTWVWNEAKYTITFKADGWFGAEADCNVLVGGYLVSGRTLTFRAGPSTMAECGPESAYHEFVTLLTQVDGYRVDGDELVLTYGDGAGEMVLTKGAAQE